VDEWQAWIERNADQVRRALVDAAVRAEVLALLGTDDADRRQRRRLAAARAELAGLEVHWRIGEDPWET
jgi:hypothetical protein